MPLVNRTFDQLIDFTRTSAATYVNSSGNIASTPQSRNLLTFTQEFDNAAWVKEAATVAANVVAPDGTSTADRFSETATTATHAVVQTVSSVSAAQHVFSVYLKKGTGATAPDWVQVTFGGVSTGWVNFNLSTGAVGVASGGTGAITSVGSGWYRCSVLVTIAGAGAASVQVVFTNNTDSVTRRPSYAGATTSDVFAWGAQLEQASSATDYTRNFGGLFPPRFDYDPVTRAPRGLLIEEQRTNLLVRSEEFDNASFTKVGSTATANTTTSPDGTVDADSLAASGGNTQHYVNQSFSFTSGTTYTLSVFAKKNTLNGVQLTFGSGAFGTLPYANFDLNAGTSFTSNCTATMTNFGNGWYRCTMTATANGTTSAGGVIALARDTTESRLPTFDSDGNGIFVYGAQLEVGAFATSYIPTVASQVTRTVDVALIQAPNFAPWYNQSAGTFVVSLTPRGVPAGGNNVRFLEVNDGNITNRNPLMYASSAGTTYTQYRVSGVDQASLGSSTSYYAANSTITIGAAYAANDFATSFSGGAVQTDTSGSVVTNASELDIGYARSGAGAEVFCGWIRSIRYYPTRLTNAQLQALTA